jgi:prephenate dehydratase
MSNSKIAILGPKGTFSEEAAVKFNLEFERVLCDSLEGVFESVKTGEAEFGIVPVENSLEGSVGNTLEMLFKSDLTICRELVLEINHNLLVLPNTKLGDITEVVSHPQALAQCREYLKSFEGLKTRNTPSTAEAAREVANKRLKRTAAIAPKIASTIYGLVVLAEGIQDFKDNRTRFFIISFKCPDEEDKKKTSIVLGLKDRPGALYEILGHFANEDINLTKIESRPSKRGLGEYLFYLDFIGAVEDEKIKNILEKLKKLTSTLKVLGSYPFE